MSKILITGNRGFVGSETQKLIESRNSYDNIPLKEGELFEVIGYDIMDGYDIRDYNQLNQFVTETKPDRILHLAAVARFADADKDPKLAFETNVMGTRNVALVAQKHHIPLVYSSTGSVYMPIDSQKEPPITEDWSCKGNSVYGCTKYAGELYVKDHTPHIILRYAHLYGKEKRGHGLIGGFWQRIERGLVPTLYGGQQSNDFTYIKDVAQANFLALTASWDKWNQVYNIGTGEELTAEQAGKLVCEATGWKGGIEKKEGRTVDAERFVYDITKAKTWLGFNPEYDFKKGLEEMFNDR
jgi:UDP-glucose 4-epimerase